MPTENLGSGPGLHEAASSWHSCRGWQGFDILGGWFGEVSVPYAEFGGAQAMGSRVVESGQAWAGSSDVR